MLSNPRMRFGGIAVAGDPAEEFTPALEEPGMVGLTEPRCRLDQSIEDRLQIESRAADDLEHIGGGGLLLEGFAQLIEQARVLDGDNRLCREVLHHLDLFVRERL